MINKGRKRIARNQKKTINQYTNNNFLNPSKEPRFYTKVKLSTYKIDLSEISSNEFIYRAQEYFYSDLIYKKYFEIGDLFSLNKNSSYKEITKINYLLDELKLNETGSPRVIFFQSPPMIGMSYIIKYFNINNFKFYLWNNTYGNNNKKEYKKYLNKSEINSNEYKDGSILMEYQKLVDVIKENKNKNNTFFIVLKNLPYDLFIMSLKENIYSANFVKNWKPIILLFFDLIYSILKMQEYSNIKLIFFTDDKEIDEFELKTIFPNNIVEHPLTKVIICNPIPQRKINDIIRNFLGIFIPPIFDESNYKNIIESIYLEFGSNIQQILDYLLLEINSRYYLNNYKLRKINQNKSQKPLTQRGKSKINDYSESQKNSNIKWKNTDIDNIFQIKKEQQLDHDLFRLLGKLLYNKRYVKGKKAILKLKKEEFNNMETPRYYDINELINDIPISKNSFNDLLIYNSIEHFNDIEEYSLVFDLYSYTDTLDNFESYLYDKYNQYFYNNSYMKTYLNCLGVTTYNLSQYNNGPFYKFNKCSGDKGLMTIKKPNIKINKNINKFNDNSFYKSCEHFPYLIFLNIKQFYKEGFFDFYKIFFIDNCENKIGNIIKGKDNNNNNIKYYCKEKENKKFFEDNECEINENKRKKYCNDNNNSPKNIKMRNIPEEDKIALENMINGFDDGDSGDDVIEE